jgi:hypothetical protein
MHMAYPRDVSSYTYSLIDIKGLVEFAAKVIRTCL